MSLRLRLILSHVAPILIIIPAMGLALVSALEHLVFLPRMSEEIRGDLDIIHHVAADPLIWLDPRQRARFVAALSDYAPWRMTMLDPEGHVLASTDPREADRIGQAIDQPVVDQALRGQTVVLEDISTASDTEVIEGWTPVVSPQGDVLGVIRLSLPVETVTAQLARLRSLMTAILLVGVGAGLLVALASALTIERPLRRITRALSELAEQSEPGQVPVRGPPELQTLAATFNHLVDRLRAMESARKQLLANLVHELGRPLGAMRAAIRALSEGASSDPTLRTNLLSGMDLQTRDLERLVQDLTRLYDSSAGGLPMQPERTDLNPWLQDTLRPWQAAAEQKGIVWETFLEPLPTLWIDPLRLGQALSNLLSNAVKFTSPGGQVRVVAQPSGDEVRLSVEDTGPGLTPEDREHLFTPFYRARHATRFPQGMGLGLAIARQLVIAHGGTIDVESAPGKGSRFTIRLPITPQPSSPAI